MTPFLCYGSLQKKLHEGWFNYLAKKGLDIDLWAESIIDGRKPDFLVLFALNVLIETHAIVHTKNGKVWMMLEAPPEDHYELLNVIFILPMRGVVYLSN